MSCEHKQFHAHVGVARLEDSGRFMAEITIHCAECELPFEFRGLPLGMHMDGAAMSPDALEARIAIAPQGKYPNPIQAAMQGKDRFDA